MHSYHIEREMHSKDIRILRVLCTAYTKYPKVMTKRSVVSLILFSTCKFVIHGNKHVHMHIAIIHPLT